MAIIAAADLKVHLGISDSTDDTTIGYAVAAANQAVTEYCGRTFDTTTTGGATARVFRPDGLYRCRVDDFWDTSVLVVKSDETDDGTFETTWTITTDFYLDPLNGKRHGQPWPYSKIISTGNRLFPRSWSGRGLVQVTAAWGWTATPGSVFEAALIMGAKLWKRKNSPEGVLGGYGDFGLVRVSRKTDPDVIELLGPFVHPDKSAMVG